MTRTERAVEAARLGRFLFPLQPGSKVPFAGFRWRLESSGDQGQIERWAKQYPDCNWGIDTGKSGLVVVDVDVKNGKRGDLVLTELIVDGFDVPRTYTLRTPSGGQQLFYRGRTQNGVNVLGDGLDIRSDGGYVLLPGSVVNGREYAVTMDVPEAPCPEWIIQKVGAPRLKTANNVVPLVPLDQPHNVTRARLWLQAHPPAVQGQGGDAHTYRTACHLKDLGVSEPEALDLLLDWNETCLPPWSVDELSVKVANAYKYGANRPGAAAPEAVFEPLPPDATTVFEPAAPPSDDDLLRGLRFVTLEDAILKPAPPRTWIVPDWLPAGETVLFTGAGGAGKSQLALQLCYSAAYGVPWLGQKVTHTLPALYIACEDDENEIKRRSEQVRISLPEYSFLPHENVLSPEEDYDSRLRRPVSILPRVGMFNSLVIEKDWELKMGPFWLTLGAIVRRKAKFAKGPFLLVLDTLSDFFQANESNRTIVTKFVKEMLGSLKKDYGVTIVTLAHPPKGDAKTYSGSTAWEGSHRAVINVAKHEDKALSGTHRVLELTKANYAQSGALIYAVWSGGAYAAAADGGADILGDIEEENLIVVESLIRAGAEENNPWNESAIAARPLSSAKVRSPRGVDLDTKEIRNLVNVLISRGRVVRVKGGKRRNGLYPAERSVRDQGQK